MKLFRFLAYCFAFFLGAVFAFQGGNSFPAPPPKQYRPKPPAQQVVQVMDAVTGPGLTADVEAGRTRFTTLCASCHNRNMKDDLTGPALGEARENWSGYPAEDLYNWIRNSQAMITAGHPRALELWKVWQPAIMPSFPNLSDEEINTLLAYMEAVYAS